MAIIEAKQKICVLEKEILIAEITQKALQQHLILIKKDEK